MQMTLSVSDMDHDVHTGPANVFEQVQRKPSWKVQQVQITSLDPETENFKI